MVRTTQCLLLSQYALRKGLVEVVQSQICASACPLLLLPALPGNASALVGQAGTDSSHYMAQM